ncbi:hypothetical protein LR48_Vigan01g031600 [Vigna angularis]|uniref:Uncharacterized protein n=1 Tax=Phaseolus angularis TaxID=3914 RepID=A0A0L9TJV9_PHAAN|nr:hypothetical protein LR48_Vigan01g031600 [Vigna angularis]
MNLSILSPPPEKDERIIQEKEKKWFNLIRNSHFCPKELQNLLRLPPAAPAVPAVASHRPSRCRFHRSPPDPWPAMASKPLLLFSCSKGNDPWDAYFLSLARLATAGRWPRRYHHRRSSPEAVPPRR